MRRALLPSLFISIILAGLGACDYAERGWRGSMTGDYRLVAACAADRLALSPTLREDQGVAILARGPRLPVASYAARLQQTSPGRFFAEIGRGAEHPAGITTWQAIEDCAEGGPDRIQPPASIRAAL